MIKDFISEVLLGRRLMDSKCVYCFAFRTGVVFSVGALLGHYALLFSVPFVLAVLAMYLVIENESD